MECIIKPYKGAGQVNFGMTRDEVAFTLRETPESFKKSEEDLFETDAFSSCFVYYKEPGICEAIEFIEPAKIKFIDVSLFEIPYREIEAYFLKQDKDIEIDESGFTSYKFGVGIYAPLAYDSPDDRIESVIIFEKGYYKSE